MVDVGISAGRTNRISPSGRLAPAADQPDGVLQRFGVLEIERRDAADAFHVNVRRRDLLAEGQCGQQHQLAARVVAIHVGARVGFGVSQALRLGDHGLHRGAGLFDLGQDVVAGAVENAVQRLHAVARDALAQHGVDRNAAAHRRLHGEIDARLNGAIPDLRPAGRHEFLVGRDHALAIGDGGVDDLRGHRGAAHQFGDNLHVRMRHHFAPVRSLEDVAKSRGNLFGVHRAAAHGHHLEPVPELERDLIPVFGQYGKRAGPDVAQTHDANIDFLHILP